MRSIETCERLQIFDRARRLALRFARMHSRRRFVGAEKRPLKFRPNRMDWPEKNCQPDDGSRYVRLRLSLASLGPLHLQLRGRGGRAEARPLPASCNTRPSFDGLRYRMNDLAADSRRTFVCRDVIVAELVRLQPAGAKFVIKASKQRGRERTRRREARADHRIVPDHV